MVKKIVVILATTLLVSCGIRTNIGPYVINQVETEGRSNSVEVYGPNEIFKYDARFVGHVESGYCQNERYGEMPPKQDLQRTLKAKAQKLGANGIVYEPCELKRDFSGCERYLRCEGSAYKITI